MARVATSVLARFLEEVQNHPDYDEQIVHVERIPARPAQHGELEQPLPPALQTSLNALGIERLYTHQAEAINHVRAGRNVVVATSTASGKTLCYNLPVIEALHLDPRARAIYLFPTKALAQDQLRSVGELLRGPLASLRFALFDGDTPARERTQVRKTAQVLLTNPDMLHLSILPNHSTWSAFLRRLRFVVVDESHVYRGVFGSQIANVLRRLRRVCQIYGSRPHFILSSATIANPGEHAARLIGEPVEVVDRDGAPHGERIFVFWNPPVIDPVRAVRRSANWEAAMLLQELVRREVRTLAFTRTRRLAEVVYLHARDALAAQHPELAQRLKPYRAGYLAEDRRAIERALFRGELLGVSTTNALELGVDIGDLDSTILTGYPGTIASTWQQAGRAGRGTGDSLSILVALDNPLDQYFMRHPDTFFGRSPEHALIDPDNPRILEQHLVCAAYEAPLHEKEAPLFGPRFHEVAEALVGAGRLVRRPTGIFPSVDVSYPAQDVNVRSTTSDVFEIVDIEQQRVIETVEATSAFFQIHPGASYLHQGETYLIQDLDLAGRVAYAQPQDLPYYTMTREDTNLEVLETIRTKRVGGAMVSVGRVRVTTQVVGFQRRRPVTEEVLSEEPLDLPPQAYETVAFWWNVPDDVGAMIRGQGLDFPGALHAAEHAAIGLLPLYAMCDRRDIGGLSTPLHPDTGQATIFIYDGHAGGVGIAERGWELVDDLWQRTLDLVRECPCEEGCPSCIQSPKCGNGNEPLDKQGAVYLLQGLLAG